MNNTRLTRVLLILLIILASVYLAQMLWQLVSNYADLLLLFLLGWLVAFILNPVVFQLSMHPIPDGLARALEPALGVERGHRLRGWHISRGLAVVIVYLVLLFAVVVFVAVFAPTAIAQLSLLARQIPEYMAQAPAAGMWLQGQLARFGVRVDVQDALRTALASLQGYAAALIQNALGIFTSLLTLLANFFFVLILGFIITLDGPRLRHGILRVVPDSFNDEIQFLERSIDRTFGGFIRGQLIQAILQLVATAVVMTLFRLDFVLIASLFAGLFMLIPLVGPFLALLPPLLVVLFESPGATLWVLGILFVFQFVVVNILMPRLMSEAVGLHPLLVFAAILFSIKIAGFWGAFFGIPVVGVLWAMGKFLLEEWQRASEAARSQPADQKMD